MSNAQNPTMNGAAQTQRFGPQSPHPLQQVDRTAGGASADETVPTQWQQCFAFGRSTHVELVIVAPAWVEAYDVTYGRWSQTADNARDPTLGFQGPVQLGTLNVFGATVNNAKLIEFPLRGDRAYAFITNIVGTPVPSQGGVRIYARGYSPQSGTI